jgi:dipeptidyl aminopeptidase/acylaminoacyl peptidase
LALGQDGAGQTGGRSGEHAGDNMRLWGGLVAGLCAGVWSAASAAPLEAYGTLPSLEHFTVSPDGKDLAYATFVNGKRTVLINDIAGGKVIGGFEVAGKLRGLDWADNGHVLATISVTRTVAGAISTHGERWLAESYNVAAKSADMLLSHNDDHMMLDNSDRKDQMNILGGLPMPRTIDGRPTTYLVGFTFINNSAVETLFVTDLDAVRKSTIVETGSAKFWTEWMIDGAGTIVARTTFEDDSGRWALQVKQGAGYKDALVSQAPLDQPSVLGITPDGKSIVVVVPNDSGSGLKQFSLADGSPQTAPDMPWADIEPVEDPATHRMIGVKHDGFAAEYKFFDPADQRAWDGLANAFPGENVELQSWSADRKIVVVRVDGKRDGAAYFMIDRNTHKASFLGPVYSGIDLPDVADRTLISYKAADGMTIPAFLTLPNGKAPKNLALIVLPHGGPAGHDDMQFDWLAQGLASRGYAVLQPEFRGSDGSGWDHLTAGYGQWGRKMQSDLSDGVRFLAGQGTIDPKRVCIVGGSYGGYAALAGATLDKGVYRCAVSDAGIGDLHAFLQWKRDRIRDSDSSVLRYEDRLMGADNIDDPKLATISPIAHIADVQIPILLIHGQDDTVVPIEQSEAMDAALRAAGKPVTFVKLDGEDHWLSKPETRLQMLKATVAFLEANNPPN